MANLRGSYLTYRTSDGYSTTTEVKYEDMQDYLTTYPVKEINLSDEEGNFKPDTITIEEITSLCQTTLDALFEAWMQLWIIMNRHESTLNKRWLKKTMDQRKETLSKVCPDIPRMHRPDFAVLRAEALPQGKTKIAADFAVRLPNINIEDLSYPKPLLWMLDSRSRNFPSIFTNADQDSIRVGIESKRLVPKYIRGYTMYLNGEWSRDTYGRLVSWEEDRQALLKCFRGIAPDPGTGLLILEIQRDVLQFLVRTSAALLHDITSVDLVMRPLERLPDTSLPEILARRVGKTGSKPLATEHESLTAHTLEAPYRAPDIFDFARLKSLVEAKCHEADDHFLLLREDPGFFAEMLHEGCGHTVEAILNRQYNQSFTTLSEPAWDEAISRVLMQAYHDVFMWHTVSCLLNRLIDTYTKHTGRVQLGEELPEEYMKVFSRLGFLLDCVLRGYLDGLTLYMSAVPTFKQHITNEMRGERRLITVRKKPDDHLFWLFTELLRGQNGQGARCDLPHVFQEVEILITKDQQQKKRLTWRLIRLVSDLAVVAELQRQMGLSSCTGYLFTVWSDKENDVWLKKTLAPLFAIREIMNGRTKLAPLVMDLRMFNYPSDKPRTAATTAKMRSAEQALDVFWEKLNEYFILKTGKSLQTLEVNYFQHRDIQRTPLWAPVEEIRDHSKFADGVSIPGALATLVERTERTVEESKPLVAREKIKTRGYPAQHSLEQGAELTPEAVIDSLNIGARTITIKRKAFNTFAALFGRPVADKLPGELPWNDFKRAMVNVGFGAQKLQGSAWLFASEKGNIIFHEPHPESKLPMQWARRIARRLNRNFGWTMDTFVLDGVVGDKTAF